MTKILVEMSPVYHAVLLDSVSKESGVYSALINSTTVPVGDREVVQFVCDESQTRKILEAAQRHCPAAVNQIVTSLSRSRIKTH